MAEPQEQLSYSQPPEELDQPQELAAPQGPGVVVGLPGQTSDGLPQPTLPQPNAAPPEPSPQTLDKRTFKVSYGGIAALIGQTDEGIKAQLAAGQEDGIRREAAAKIDFNTAQSQHAKIVAASVTKGGPLDPEEVKRILDPWNPNSRPADINEVIEKAYATTYVSAANTAASFMPDNFLARAKGEIPDQVDSTEAKAVDLATLREFIHTKEERIKDVYDKQGWLGWTGNQVQLMFQPYSEYKLRALMKEIGVVSGGVLLPDNIESTVDAIYASPNPKEHITRILDGMSDNPTLQLMFAQMLLGQTTSEKNLGRVFSVLGPLDLLAAGGIIKRLLTKVGLFDNTQKAYRDVAKSLEVEHPTPATIAESAGNVDQAATLRVVDNLNKTYDGTIDPTKVGRESLMTGFRQDAELLANNTGGWSREAVVRLHDGVIRSGESLLKEVEEMSKVQRTPAVLAKPENVEAIKAVIAGDYRGPKSTLLDIGDPVPNELTNTHDWPVRSGDFNGKLFATEERATTFATEVLKLAPGAYRLGKAAGEVRKSEAIFPTAATIKQKGVGFYIEQMIPFNEGQSLVKDLMIRDLKGNIIPDAVGTSSASGFSNIQNGVFGWVRGANQTLSKNEMMQRNAATFSTSGLRAWLKSESQSLRDIAAGKIRNDEITGEPIPWYRSSPRPITGKLTKEEAKEQFSRTLKFAQDAPDPHNNGEPGYFFKTIGELQDHYLRHFERPPSFNEANAYFSFVKLVEAERVLMEISEYKYRSRLGVQQHQFWFRGDNNTKVSSGFIDGVERKELPGGSENILVMGDKPGEERLHRTDNLPVKLRERLKDEISKGQTKVIQLYSSGQRPLKDFSKIAGGERVVYVATSNIETKPLEYNHVNRRAGGHFDFEYDNAVKQPIITHSKAGDVASDKRGSKVEALYEGDNTYGLADNRAMGKDFARRLNDVVDLMDAKKMDEAKAKYLEHKLPQDWEEFKGLFQPKRGPDGKVVLPKYSTSEHFHVVPKGKQISDLPVGKELEAKHEGAFRDGTRSGDLSKQFQVNYNQERAEDRVYAINDKGKPGRPDYQYQPADMADPMATFSRSINRMINSTFMDDYKIYTVEHWLREASPYLKPKESELRSAPFANFVTPEWKSGLNDVDLMKKSNLLSNRYKAREFIGLPSKYDTTLHQLTQQIADTMWESTNPLKRGALLVPRWLLPYHKEPVAVARALVYDFKLGLYAAGQILTQFNSWTTTLALEPRHGSAGTFASLLHSWSAVNSTPEMLKYLDNAATKIDMGKLTLGGSRWRPGEYIEGRRELIRSGFLNVGGEMADLDVFDTASIVKGAGEFRQAGRKPFQWGEKAARIPAYYTAFRKFREENPFTPLTELNRQEILRHANILTNNMTRASNSVLNEGIASLPMQFLNYTYRLGETFAGKEIGETMGERALARVRLMGVYGAMYGIPSAIGVTGLPLGDKARKYALDNFGYIPGEHWYSTALMEGWPALFLNKTTGNNYDIGGKWGTKGMTTISDFFRGDKSFMQMLGGAGYDNMYKFIASFDGWYKAMISFARQDPADQRFKLTFDDMIKPALNISSVNSFNKGYTGVTMGKWIATNGTPAMDVSKLNSIFMATTGLNPTEQTDAWLKGDIRKQEKQLQKDAVKSFMADMQRSDMAAKNKDPQAAETYHRNGFATLHAAGLPPNEILAAIAQAAKAKTDSIKRSDYDFYLGADIPLEKRPGRRDTFVRSKQLQQGNQ